MHTQAGADRDHKEAILALNGSLLDHPKGEKEGNMQKCNPCRSPQCSIQHCTSSMCSVSTKKLFLSCCYISKRTKPVQACIVTDAGSAVYDMSSCILLRTEYTLYSAALLKSGHSSSCRASRQVIEAKTGATACAMLALPVKPNLVSCCGLVMQLMAAHVSTWQPQADTPRCCSVAVNC